MKIQQNTDIPNDVFVSKYSFYVERSALVVSQNHYAQALFRAGVTGQYFGSSTWVWDFLTLSRTTADLNIGFINKFTNHTIVS